VTGGGLLAVHAHPDDETLATGALLATWAAAGRPVTVVTCTRGERGEVIRRRLAHLSRDAAALATHRTGELEAALGALGVGDHVVLDQVAGDGPWTDSGMVWVEAGIAGPGQDLPDGAFVAVDVEHAAGRLASVIRDRRPDVVVGDEPGGGYGHPDHVHAHRVAARALELAAEGPDGWAVPCVLWSAVDGQAWRSAAAALGPAVPAGTVGPDPDGPAPSAVVPPVLVDVRVDVAPVLAAVAAALRAHATQVQLVAVASDEQPPALPADVLGRYALSNAVVRPLLRHECYRSVRGAAGVDWPAGVTAR
jgi:N-acetyl-1-D-myo-inositol-2-amino-2-deoxy-alpha-D-glucopyranoside deacetylase